MKPAKPKTLEDIRELCVIDDSYGCWIWADEDSIDTNGRATVINPRTHKIDRAYRVAYEFTHGPIAAVDDDDEPDPSKPSVVDHRCNDRRCCRPLHLELVTRGVNEQRKVLKFRVQRITRCVRGHLFDEFTRVMTTSGGIVCRRCIADDRAGKGTP